MTTPQLSWLFTEPAPRRGRGIPVQGGGYQQVPQRSGRSFAESSQVAQAGTSFARSRSATAETSPIPAPARSRRPSPTPFNQPTQSTRLASPNRPTVTSPGRRPAPSPDRSWAQPRASAAPPPYRANGVSHSPAPAKQHGAQRPTISPARQQNIGTYQRRPSPTPATHNTGHPHNNNPNNNKGGHINLNRNPNPSRRPPATSNASSTPLSRADDPAPPSFSFSRKRPVVAPTPNNASPQGNRSTQGQSPKDGDLVLGTCTLEEQEIISEFRKWQAAQRST